MKIQFNTNLKVSVYFHTTFTDYSEDKYVTSYNFADTKSLLKYFPDLKDHVEIHVGPDSLGYEYMSFHISFTDSEPTDESKILPINQWNFSEIRSLVLENRYDTSEEMQKLICKKHKIDYNTYSGHCTEDTISCKYDHKTQICNMIWNGTDED